MRVTMVRGAFVLGALLLGAAPAAANPAFVLGAYGPSGLDDLAAYDAFSRSGETEAPGLESARIISLTPAQERELITPFGAESESFEPFNNRPINEFAGQRHRFEPGLIGEALGQAKRGILRSFEKR